MKNNIQVKTPNRFRALFNNKCPHCRKGNMFQDTGSYHLKSFMKANEKCPVCSQVTEIEEGFYYGTAYISYGLTVGFSILTFILWWLFIGISVSDNRVFWWMVTNAVLMLVLQPYLMRFSRTVWLSIFVKYDANWKTERKKPIAG